MTQKVYILTNFSQFLKAYSPIIVVATQLKMLKRHGYNPVLIVSEGWDPPEGIFTEVETVRIPPIHVYGEPKELSEEDIKEVDTLYEQLKNVIEDNSVVITHDLIFLPDYVKHNLSARRLASENPSISWLHWVHSATSPQGLIAERNMYGEQYKDLINDKFPNSVIAYPNSYAIPRVAINFNYEEDEVFEVPHATDLVEKWQTHPIVQRLMDEKELWEDDVIMVYPCRLDRGKNVEANVMITHHLNHMGVKAHLVVVDFHSTGDDKVVYRNELKQMAEERDIADKVTFMSEFDSSCELETPHKIVHDLFRFANVMVMPSKSETYSLVAQEALADGALLICNNDFQAFRQIYGNHAIYRQVGGANQDFNGLDGEIKNDFSDKEEHFRRIAQNIVYHLQNNKVLSGKTWVRKERNLDHIFRNYMEPLIWRRVEGDQ